MEWCRYPLCLWPGDSSRNVDHLLAGAGLSECGYASKRRLPAVGRLVWFDCEHSNDCIGCHSSFHATVGHAHSDLLYSNAIDHIVVFDIRHLGSEKSIVTCQIPPAELVVFDCSFRPENQPMSAARLVHCHHVKVPKSPRRLRYNLRR